MVAQDTFAGRTVSAGWGTSSDGKGWSVQIGTASALSVSGNAGHMTSTDYCTLGSSTATDEEGLVRFTSGDYSSDDGRMVLRFSDTSNYYAAGIASPNNAPELDVYKNKAGSFTRLAGTAIALTSGAPYWERVRVVTSGTSAVISVRAWKEGTAEPSTWGLTVTDTAPVPAGVAGVEGWDGGAGWAMDHYSAGKLN